MTKNRLNIRVFVRHICLREKKGLRDSETLRYLMGVDKASEAVGIPELRAETSSEVEPSPERSL